MVEDDQKKNHSWFQKLENNAQQALNVVWTLKRHLFMSFKVVPASTQRRVPVVWLGMEIDTVTMIKPIQLQHGRFQKSLEVSPLRH